MTKVRGKPAIAAKTLDLFSANVGDVVQLADGYMANVIAVNIGGNNNNNKNLSCTVQGYGSAQYYLCNGLHIYNKCPQIVALIKKR